MAKKESKEDGLVYVGGKPLSRVHSDLLMQEQLEAYRKAYEGVDPEDDEDCGLGGD